MSELIPPCSPKHNPEYLISYSIGSKFSVCKTCANLEHFARGIKSKERIDLNTRKKNPGYGHTYVNLKGTKTS